MNKELKEYQYETAMIRNVFYSILSNEQVALTTVAFFLRNYPYFITTYETKSIYHQKYTKQFLKHINETEIFIEFQKEWININKNTDKIFDYCYRGNELNNLTFLYYLNTITISKTSNGIQFDNKHPDYKSLSQIFNSETTTIPIFIDANTVPNFNNAKEPIHVSIEFRLFTILFFTKWNSIENVIEIVNDHIISWEIIQILKTDLTETDSEINKFNKKIFKNILEYELALHGCKEYENKKYDIQPIHKKQKSNDFINIIEEDERNNITENDINELDDNIFEYNETNKQPDLEILISSSIFTKELSKHIQLMNQLDKILKSEKSSNIILESTNLFQSFFKKPELKSHETYSNLITIFCNNIQDAKLNEFINIGIINKELINKEIYKINLIKTIQEKEFWCCEIDLLLMKNIALKYKLNREQALPFFIFAAQVKGNLFYGTNQFIQMIIFGGGGTGKSHIIFALTEYFTKLNISYALLKCAFTNSVASKMEGFTISSAMEWKGITSIPRKLDYNKTLMRSTRFINLNLGIFDEFSIIDANMLYQIFESIKLYRVQFINQELTTNIPMNIYDILNLLFIGDPLQLPPIGKFPVWKNNINYNIPEIYTNTITKSKTSILLGQIKWLEIKYATELTINKRCNPDYTIFNNNLRNGIITDNHLIKLNSRKLNLNYTTELGTFLCEENDLRQSFNYKATQSFAFENERKLIWCLANDHISNELKEELYKQNFEKTDMDFNGLPHIIPLVIGAQYMLTKSKSTYLKIVKSMKCTLIRIHYK